MALLVNELGEFVEMDDEADAEERRKRLYQRKACTGSEWLPLGEWRKCETCGGEYMPKTRNQRYCSRPCALEGKAAEREAARRR